MPEIDQPAPGGLLGLRMGLRESGEQDLLRQGSNWNQPQLRTTQTDQTSSPVASCAGPTQLAGKAPFRAGAS